MMLKRLDNKSKVLKGGYMKKSVFKKTNLYCEVDYDYERSQCTCNAYENGDYCRCTTIENAWIEKVNVNDVVNELYRNHSKTDSYIDKYCFDRICYAFKIYDKYLYEIEICGGYYGEEIEGVYFYDEEKIVNAYRDVISFDTDIEKIRYCLKLEYGCLLNCVVSASSAIIDKLPPYNICLPQKEYFAKLDKNVIEEYKDRALPIAVCVKDGNRLRLIDGYHRFVANKDRNTIEIIILQ